MPHALDIGLDGGLLRPGGRPHRLPPRRRRLRQRRAGRVRAPALPDHAARARRRCRAGSLFGEENAGKLLWATQPWMSLNALPDRAARPVAPRRALAAGQVAPVWSCCTRSGASRSRSSAATTCAALWFGGALSTSQVVAIAVVLAAPPLLLFPRARGGAPAARGRAPDGERGRAGGALLARRRRGRSRAAARPADLSASASFRAPARGGQPVARAAPAVDDATQARRARPSWWPTRRRSSRAPSAGRGAARGHGARLPRAARSQAPAAAARPASCLWSTPRASARTRAVAELPGTPGCRPRCRAHVRARARSSCASSASRGACAGDGVELSTRACASCPRAS